MESWDLQFPLADYLVSYIVRHLATNYDAAAKYLGNAIPLKLLFGLISIIITLICLIILKTPMLSIIITLMFTIELIFKSMIGLFNGTFQAYEEGKYQGIGNILMNTLTLIFILNLIIYLFLSL